MKQQNNELEFVNKFTQKINNFHYIKLKINNKITKYKV